MIVIPAIDLLDGQVVRLHKGSYQEVTVYHSSAVEQAAQFKKAGFDHIHVVDLNGAKAGRFVNLPHIRQIINELGLSVQTGGGIRTFEDVQLLLDHGIQKVICSSMAVKNQEDWFKALEKYPRSCILGMDLKDGKVAYAGWLETLDQSLEEFLKPMIDRGLKTILSTDISKDGTLSGPNFELYQDLMESFPGVEFIASGGVSNLDDLKKLDEGGLPSAVVGKAYYEGHITLGEMAAFSTH